jgi:hypothetical protein
MGDASDWLIMIRRLPSVCSMAKIELLGMRLIETPALLTIRVRPSSSRRGVFRISVGECDTGFPSTDTAEEMRA